jgi:hypothetical protein
VRCFAPPPRLSDEELEQLAERVARRVRSELMPALRLSDVHAEVTALHGAVAVTKVCGCPALSRCSCCAAACVFDASARARRARALTRALRAAVRFRASCLQRTTRFASKFWAAFFGAYCAYAVKDLSISFSGPPTKRPPVDA